MFPDHGRRRPMPEPTAPERLGLEDIPGELVDDAVDAWHEMPHPMALDDQMRRILAAVLPQFDQVIRAEIVRWVEAKMLKCPHHSDRDTGHKALCNWCWHNGALAGALRLARGDHGSTTAYALHRAIEQERVDV